jgi:hypothetical protein
MAITLALVPLIPKGEGGQVYLSIRDQSGGTLDGVVLTIGRDRMEVALCGSAAVVELQRSYTHPRALSRLQGPVPNRRSTSVARGSI